MRRGRDGVEYAIGMIPLGGYVRMADEREAPVADADAARAFNRRPVWQRVLVLLAGAGANFLFAIVAFWVLFMHGIPGVRPVLGTITADSMAARAGLETGDEIVGVGGRAVATREGAVLEVLSHLTDDGRIDFRVRRNGHEEVATISVPVGERKALTEPGAWMKLGFAFTNPDIKAVLREVVPDGAAAAAGLKAGDEILSVDGHSLGGDYLKLRELIRPRAGISTPIEVLRGTEHLTVTVVPRARADEGDKSGKLYGQIGILGGEATYPAAMQTLERYGPIDAAVAAVRAVGEKTGITLKFLGRMVTGQVSIKNVSGPVGIANFAAISFLEGWDTFLNFLALISISLGILNLLPVPVLDGGQIVYQLAEGLLGKPLPERVQIIGQQIGIVLLVLLMSLAFYNDFAWRFG
jgi:regulator of sigma E protease